MPFRLRECWPADHARVAEIISLIDPEPVTAEEITEMEANYPEGGIRLWLVAVDSADRPVAWASVGRTPTARAGKFRCFIATDPACQGQGAGTALYDAALRFVQEHGATLLETDVRDTEAHSIRFAEQRGFTIKYHLCESVLELDRFDGAAFAGAVAKAESTGIRFFTMDQVEGEEYDRKLYDLYAATVPDQPGFDAQGYTPYANWRRRILEGVNARRDAIWVAADGEQFVGVTTLHWIEGSRAMYTEYTGVRKEYRGRGIALALKLFSVDTARRYGAVRMRTNNHSANAPMLAVNRRLGYVDQPGVFFYHKELR